jgi:hypothetical protein
MTVAPSLLDQRLRFYSRHDGGADGFMRPVYVFTGEWWGRVDVMSSSQTVATSPQAHVDTAYEMKATVYDYVPVDPMGVVRVVGSETMNYIRGVYTVRALRTQEIKLEEIGPEEFETFVLYEDTEVLDGVHLVDPA